MKKTITAIACTLITLISFAQNSGKSKDQDVAALLKSMNISTSVNATAMESYYPSVNLTINDTELAFDFSNPKASSYTLLIFDINGTLLSDKTNIIGGNTTVAMNDLPAAEYIYQLRGEGKTYCGKFLYKQSI